LCQGGVSFISGQVGQTSPFHHQGAYSGESVGGCTVIRTIGKDEIVMRDA
jgi:enamine deaminase RidA (YjgF/YER057c/UK114 family)